MLKLITISLIFFLSFSLSAQNIVNGYVRDKSTGESLINANVYEKSTLTGTISNEYGFYSLSLKNAKAVVVVVSFVGYEKRELEFPLNSDTTINVDLTLLSELDEVKVYGNDISKVRSSQMSMLEISTSKLNELPVIFGEPDVLKVIQLLPGVQSGAEGTSGIYVRGGGPDQNLFLLDGVPVYNANHLFGFFSVFNPSAIKIVKLYKGGFPARFGGRLSSVVDIRMKEGNMKEFKGDFSIGLISSSFSLEGPIKKDKTSFIVSGRRTYFDVLARPAIGIMNARNKGSNVKGGYYFYDLNTKINHKFSDKSRLYFSTYLGLDKAYAKTEDTYANQDVSSKYRDEFGLNWGNITNSLRWNYVIGPKLFSNVTITHSNYSFKVWQGSYHESSESDQKSEDVFEYNSGIRDFAAKVDFDYYPSARHSVKFGIGNIFHTFKPGVNHFKNISSQLISQTDTTFGNQNINANELRMYAEDIFDISKRFKLNIGGHFSLFNVQGNMYNSFEPRASLRFLGSDKWSLKASYAKMSQYIHLLSTATISLPTDLWLPTTKEVKPQESQQIAFGGFYKLPKGFEITVEAFYKNMDNLIEYQEGASFTGISNNWETKIEIGKGWSYGIEFLLEKKIGKTTGWIGYTWSKSERKFENLNFGEVFPAKYDRRHDISVVLAHKFNDRVDIGGTWVFGTGNATTLASQKYSSDLYGGGWNEDYVEYYSGRNSYRMPNYHRLDLGVNFHKQKKRGIRTWSFGAYNAYARENPFFLMWGDKTETLVSSEGVSYNKSKPALKQISIFSIIPSVSYSFKF